MTKSHQPSTPWEWPLAPASATRIGAAGVPRWLRVKRGRAWLTRTGGGVDAPDVWLEAGQRQHLPAGSEWVAEGWPEARIELLEAPQPAPGVSARWRVWPRDLLAT
jgi:hypothetical protein